MTTGGGGGRSNASRGPASAALLAALVITLACLTTVQSTYNSSPHVYTTDVGEIQNALPRWGTIHFTGYPVYSALGSLFVTLLRAVHVPPALAVSLFSLLWAALAAACVAALAVRLGARRWPAVVGACLYGLSTSAWMNGSIAEIHSTTMFFTALCLLLAVRYEHTGARRDLLWLAVAFVHGVLHMRAVLFLAPALAILVAPRWRDVLRAWRPIVAIGLLSPLVYLYMPLREWMGAAWTFGQTRTWRGFWAMVLDTKADRIVHPPAGAGELWQRARTVAGLFGDDVWWPLLLLGLVGVFALVALARGATERDVDAVPGDAVSADAAPADAAPADAVPGDAVPADAVPADAASPPPDASLLRETAASTPWNPPRSQWNLGGSQFFFDRSLGIFRRPPRDAWRLALGLTAAWVPYAALCLVIWEGKVSDALLAVKLPVPMIAGIGIALGLTWLAARYGNAAGRAALLAVALSVAALAVRSYRTIEPIVHDRSLAPLVADADRLSIDPADDPPVESVTVRGPSAAVPALATRPTSTASAATPPVTLMALWGHNFWALSYAQAFQRRLGGLTLVDHNADVGAIARRGMLLTPSDTVTVLNVDWWSDRVGDPGGRVHPEMIAPGIVWLREAERTDADGSIAGLTEGLGWSRTLAPGFPNAWPPARSAEPFDVNDALAIAAADVRCPAGDPSTLVVTLDWTAKHAPPLDESIALHVLGGDPAAGPIAQADRAVPVDGWRPTSAWTPGERVRDMIAVPVDGRQATVEVTAYHGDGSGGFVNGAWATLVVPPTCRAVVRDD
ncbi:MAG: DUF2723 domain-containing protein [Ardenticatenales bacterium]